MAPSCIIYLLLLLIYFFLNYIIQDFLVADKWARLNEIIGNLKEEKEEELEGEVLGNSDTGSLLFPPLFIKLLIKFIFVSICTASFFS